MKHILVVGGSSGIGLALSKQLVANKYQVTVASRNNNEELEEQGIQHVSLDISEDVADPLSTLGDELYGLAYCPGTINLKPFHRLTMDDFKHDLQVNVLGAVKVLQAMMKPLRKAKGASVVLFSTVASTLGMNFHSSIALSKSAIEGLTKSLAAEWAMHQIRVNAVAPSLTDTPLAQSLLKNGDKREAAGKRHPLGRVGTPEEVARMAAYLLSEEAGWISGQIIGVDGGMSTLKP